MEQTTIGLAGDWHGNSQWAQNCLRVFAKRGITEIYHLGDFGIWPGGMGDTYLADVSDALRKHGQILFVTPGNHENYDHIETVPLEDRGHAIGAVQWITDTIALLPRGHRWERGGRTFVSLGGAPSIDRGYRVKGRSWWRAEMITEGDVAKVVEGGPADVMLAHDSPDVGLCTDEVARIVTRPGGWSPEALRYAAEGRVLMTEAFLAAEPKLFLHGHYHIRGEKMIEHFAHPTHMVSVDCDGVDGNILTLRIDDLNVEWLD